MGVMTLAKFQTELHTVFSDRGVGNERLTLWINNAYQEVCSMTEFEDLKCRQDYDTEEGVYKYEVPDNFVKFISLFDVTNKKRLIRIDAELIGLRDTEEDSWAQPEEWSFHADILYLFPVPDSAYEINGIYLKEPTPLVAGNDVTVIPPAWDMTILLLAQKYGHLAFGDVEKANALMRHTGMNMSQRRNDTDRVSKTPQMGLQVAWSLEDLQDQE